MKISFVVGLTTLAALAMKVQSASIKSQATEFNLDNINDQLLSMNQDMSSLLEKGLTEPATKPADQKQAPEPLKPQNVPSPVPPTPKKEEEAAKPAEVKKVETPTPAKPQAAANKEAPKPATAAKTPAPKKATP